MLWHITGFLHCGVRWSTWPREYQGRRWAKYEFSEITTPRKSKNSFPPSVPFFPVAWHLKVGDKLDNSWCQSIPVLLVSSKVSTKRFCDHWFLRVRDQNVHCRMPGTIPKLPEFPIALEADPFHLPPVDSSWKKERGYEPRPSLTPDIPSFLARKNSAQTRPVSDLRREGAMAPPLIVSDMVQAR